ncbi:unnamed protein product [Symbiodinium necroappetens]|uniref:Uncharacterized protein n=1 Tax=Symbiodinium necroappetens TaxID=1628268 RepID=A0A813AP83_9DINO|nr:unnamed protein product [Symbiodinium necroappetens]
MLGETAALLQCEEGCRSCCAAEGSQESERDNTGGDPTSLCTWTWASSLGEWASRRASEFQTWTSELFSWASKEVQPYLELVWKCCIFYLDLALDVQAIVFFMSSHEFQFGLVNLLGILLSNVYTFIDMRLVVDTAGAEASEALTAGYLVPFNLHYLYLTGVTWASWRREAPLVKGKHPLLHCSRLAEALMEASISSLVQSYALAHHEISQKTAYFNFTQEQIVYFSLAFSFGNMGFALMGFDSAEGLHHLPGTSRSYAVKLLVLVMRVAEVSSRITSIALFSVCTRGWIPLQFADSWPQPLQFLCKSFLLTAGPCLVLMDFLVLIVWIWASGGDVAKAFLSVLCCMNPLLEKGNPFTVQVDLYYAMRLVEFLLAAVGVYCWVADTEHVVKALEGNLLLLRVCLASTLLSFLLLPIVRYLAEPALLQEEILTEWSAKPFLEPQKRLLKALICSNPDDLRQKVKAVISKSSKLAGTDEASLGSFFQTCVNLKGSLSDLKGRRFLLGQLEQVLQERKKMLAEPKHLQCVLEILATPTPKEEGKPHDNTTAQIGEDSQLNLEFAAAEELLLATPTPKEEGNPQDNTTAQIGADSQINPKFAAKEELQLQQLRLEILLKLGHAYWKGRGGKNPEDFKKLLKAIDTTELLTKSQDAEFDKNVKKLIEMWNSKFDAEDFEQYCKADISGRHWEAMTAWFTDKAKERDFGSEKGFLKKEADFLKLAGIVSKAAQVEKPLEVKFPDLQLAKDAVLTQIQSTQCGSDGGWQELDGVVTEVKKFAWISGKELTIQKAEQDIESSKQNEEVKRKVSEKKRANMQEQHVKLQADNEQLQKEKQKLQEEYDNMRKQNSLLKKGNMQENHIGPTGDQKSSQPKATKDIRPVPIKGITEGR